MKMAPNERERGREKAREVGKEHAGSQGCTYVRIACQPFLHEGESKCDKKMSDKCGRITKGV